MAEEFGMKIIARVHSDFPTKFGVPRQSALAEKLTSRLVFEPEYRDENALRGVEQFSHLWLLWMFSENADAGWSPTVRPPRLGGNARIGVFATRSPFRPNPLGLSCVRLIGIDRDSPDAPALILAGADLMDGTPVFDVKPYIPYTDAIPDASPGYTAQTIAHGLKVDFPEEMLSRLPENKREALISVLAQDPRPSYQDDPKRVYGFGFAGSEVRFRVEGDTLVVTDIRKMKG